MTTMLKHNPCQSHDSTAISKIQTTVVICPLSKLPFSNGALTGPTGILVSPRLTPPLAHDLAREFHDIGT